MTSRPEFNDCMKPYMKGGGPDRKLRFCTGAKICSGKAASEEEARQICISAPPKEPKVRKSRATGKSCSVEAIEKVTACLASRINFEATDMNKELRNNLSFCMCGKTEKKLSKAEQAVMALDEDQRSALVQFMADHDTSAGAKKDKILEKPKQESAEEQRDREINLAIKTLKPEQREELSRFMEVNKDAF